MRSASAGLRRPPRSRPGRTAGKLAEVEPERVEVANDRAQRQPARLAVGAVGRPFEWLGRDHMTAALRPPDQPCDLKLGHLSARCLVGEVHRLGDCPDAEAARGKRRSHANLGRSARLDGRQVDDRARKIAIVPANLPRDQIEQKCRYAPKDKPLLSPQAFDRGIIGHRPHPPDTENPIFWKRNPPIAPDRCNQPPLIKSVMKRKRRSGGQADRLAYSDVFD